MAVPASALAPRTRLKTTRITSLTCKQEPIRLAISLHGCGWTCAATVATTTPTVSAIAEGAAETHRHLRDYRKHRPTPVGPRHGIPTGAANINQEHEIHTVRRLGFEDGDTIVELKKKVDAIIAEVEAEGFDPEHTRFDIDGDDCVGANVVASRDETLEEEVERIAAEKAEAAVMEVRKRERARLLQEAQEAERRQAYEQDQWIREAKRVLAGKTLRELQETMPL